MTNSRSKVKALPVSLAEKLPRNYGVHRSMILLLSWCTEWQRHQNNLQNQMTMTYYVVTMTIYVIVYDYQKYIVSKGVLQDARASSRSFSRLGTDKSKCLKSKCLTILFFLTFGFGFQDNVDWRRSSQI